MNQSERRISEQLVRLVQILFALVVGQTLVLYRGVLLEPHARQHLIATAALVTVYMTTVLSWVDWHTTMELRPYNFNPKNPHRFSEWARLWFDVFVVTGYAYLLFSVAPFENTPNVDIGRHLLGYPIVFGLYLLSGWTRRRAYGRYASHVTAIVVFGAAFALLAWSYPVVARITDPPQAPGTLRARLNGGFLIAAFVTMLLYRVIRNRLSGRRKARKAAGLKIGVDVDGVLANQIHGVLPRIRQRFGVALSYEEITDWRLPIKTSGIDKEIELAMHDPEYVLGMPTHKDAREVLEALAGDNTLIMITARPQDAEDWTRQWLNNNALPNDDILAVKEARKSHYGAEILIDDYLGNIKEYLSETSGVAILISQPWNQDRSEVQAWIEERRLYVVDNLCQALRVITADIRPRLLSAKADRGF